MPTVSNWDFLGKKIEADCACIPAGYKTNDVEKQRFEEKLAGFAALEFGVKIKFPPPAKDSFEAENHAFNPGVMGVASRKYNKNRIVIFFMSLTADLYVYVFYLSLF